MFKRHITQRERDLQAAIHAERKRGYPDVERMVELLDAYTREVRLSYALLLDQFGYPEDAPHPDDDTPPQP